MRFLEVMDRMFQVNLKLLDDFANQIFLTILFCRAFLIFIGFELSKLFR